MSKYRLVPVEAVRNLCQGLADQQAMPDEGWRKTLDAVLAVSPWRPISECPDDVWVWFWGPTFFYSVPIHSWGGAKQKAVEGGATRFMLASDFPLPTAEGE